MPITNEELEKLQQAVDLHGDEEAKEKLKQIYDSGDYSWINPQLLETLKDMFEDDEAEPDEQIVTESQQAEVPEEPESTEPIVETVVMQHRNWKSGKYARSSLSDLLLAKDDPYAKWQIGILYERSGNTEKAISAYQSAYKNLKDCIYNPEIAADVFDLSIGLGDLYSRVGQKEEASLMYENAMEVVPDQPATEDIAKLFGIFDRHQSLTSGKKDMIVEKAKNMAIAGEASFPVSFRLMYETWLSGDLIVAQAIAEKIIEKANDPEEKACADLALSAIQKKEISISGDISGPYYQIARLLFAKDNSLSSTEIREAAQNAGRLSDNVITENWEPLKKCLKAQEQKEADRKRMEEEQQRQEAEKAAEEARRAEEERQRAEAEAEAEREAEEAKKAEEVRKAEEAKAREKRKKKNQKLIKSGSVIVAAIILAIALISFVANRPVKVDPFDYITISPTGLNGYGSVETTVDYDRLTSDLKQTVTDQNIILSYSPDTNLKNGDTLTVKVSEKGLSKVKFTKSSEELPVEDLPEGTAVDAFKDITVTFDGLDGSGTATVANNSNDPMLKAASYDIEGNSGSLKTGDTITVTVSVSNEDMLKYTEYPKETSKTYTVDGLGSYAAVISDISDESFNKLVNDEQEIATAKIQSSKYGVYKVFEEDYAYVDTRTMDSIEFATAYLASGNGGSRLSVEKKDDTDEETAEPYNRLMLVYKVTATDTTGNQYSSCLKLIVNNVIVQNGDILKYTKEDADFDSDSDMYYNGFGSRYDHKYLTEDDLYNKYIAQYKVAEKNTVTQR